MRLASDFSAMSRLLEVFARFLRLGFTAFGGPIAHLGYFEREFVERAKWLDRESFAEMVALCTVLPGPTSSQVGMLLGVKRAGPAGAIAAWSAFTAPSAIVLACVGWALRLPMQSPAKGSSPDHPWWSTAYTYIGSHQIIVAALSGALTGVAITALAVVLFAVISLARTIVRSRFAKTYACVGFCLALAQLTYLPQYSWATLAVGALAGAFFAPRLAPKPSARMSDIPVAYGLGVFALFIVTLLLLPLFATDGYAKLFAETFRAGSLVFGGGHVVLAFLLDAKRPDPSTFVGYGIAQAMPGPLFSFASLFGATDNAIDNSFVGAAIATIGIFAPSAFILPAALSLWTIFARWKYAGPIVAGLNVSVVGLLGATFVVVARAFDFVDRPLAIVIPVFITAFALLARAKWPSWLVVSTIAAACALYALIPNVPTLLKLV